MNPDAQLSYLKLSRMLQDPELIIRQSGSDIIPLTVTGTRYIDSGPRLICMGVMMSCMWGVSYDIIEKRSKKLLRRMVQHP